MFPNPVSPSAVIPRTYVKELDENITVAITAIAKWQREKYAK